MIKSQTDFSFSNSHISSEWKPFHELLPVLKNRDIPLLSRRKVFLGLCQKCSLVCYQDMSIQKRPDHAITNWICNRPFPNLIKTLMIYYVKTVDRFGQNLFNSTFTKYGLVFM